MSQRVVAGLGNLYVDETLVQTSIHPRRTIVGITDAEHDMTTLCDAFVLDCGVAPAYLARKRWKIREFRWRAH